jgi:hypothetical protein
LFHIKVKHRTTYKGNHRNEYFWMMTCHTLQLAMWDDVNVRLGSVAIGVPQLRPQLEFLSSQDLDPWDS